MIISNDREQLKDAFIHWRVNLVAMARVDAQLNNLPLICSRSVGF